MVHNVQAPTHLSIRCSSNGQTAIWQLSISSSNVTGSWVFPDGDEQLDSLVTGTQVVADPDRMTTDLRRAISDEIDRLDAAFSAFAESTDHALVAPTWPSLTPPALPSSPNRPAAATAALAPALRIERLMGEWADLEQERLRVLNGLLGYRLILDREIEKRIDTTAATSQRRLAADQKRRTHTETAIERYRPDGSRTIPLG